jgi:hypothetical protein
MQLAEINVWATIAKDVLLGIAAAATALFAYLGLSAWRKELKGKAEYELAKDVMKSVYRVREAFKHVRNPAIFQYEYPSDMVDQSGHVMREHDYDATAHVYESRWKQLDEAFAKLEDYHLAAQVEWGSKYQNVIMGLRSCRAELLVTTQRFLQRKKNAYDMPLTAMEQKAEERSVLYHLGADSELDKFTPEINAAIGEFEKWLRPHIQNRS